MVDRLAGLIPPWSARADAVFAAAAQPTEPLLMRLDPARRAQVFMALLGLLLLGGLLVAVIVMWGRRARRIARMQPRPTTPADHWYRKPLTPPAATDRSQREPE
jgi:hypothetical protein